MKRSILGGLSVCVCVCARPGASTSKDPKGKMPRNWLYARVDYEKSAGTQYRAEKRMAQNSCAKQQPIS